MPAPAISPFTLWFFRLITRVLFRLNFRAVRISTPLAFTALAQTPNLILYGNHSSWWDPMIAVLLAQKLMPARNHYAPMDATQLTQHKILQKIGIFPVEINSARGAAQFLRTSVQILAENGVVWVTPQGRFADVRERPLAFKPGLASLSARVPGGCTVLPLAIEYVFWNERKPEALIHFGHPFHVAKGETPDLEAPLLQAMEELKAKAFQRDPAAFDLQLSGKGSSR